MQFFHQKEYVYLYLIKIFFKQKNMIAANFTEFRSELKKYLDEVENNNETLIIKRKTGKGTVLISLDEYNSIMETIHLLRSKANADRLFESIRQMRSNQTVKHEQIEG